MTIRAIDHIAVPARDIEAMLVFYKRLGCPILDEDRWRAGQAELVAIVVGDQKINVHPPALWQNVEFTLRGPAALPGSGDICFVWDGTLADLQTLLMRAGAAVEVGPVPRAGGRAGGTETGTSLYTRDPDGNLLEFIVYM